VTAAACLLGTTEISDRVTVLSSEHDQGLPIDEAVDLGANIDDAYQGPGPGDPPANIPQACRVQPDTPLRFGSSNHASIARFA
jgi:hypothetical protein